MIKNTPIKQVSSFLFAPLLSLYPYFRLIWRIRTLAALGRLSTVTVFFLVAAEYSAYGSDRPVCQNQGLTSLGKRSVPGVIKKIGTRAESRLRAYFERAGVPYPPSRLTLIGLKDEMELEIWAEKDGRWVHIATYDVLAASGCGGPKQKAGDLQVPEGVYRIITLNPNSRFHLSMKLDYPNNYDRMKAREDGRSNLGGDIYVHGKAKSKGCLAVGDAAIEELFVLAAKTGTENTKVVIVPYDFRKKTPKTDWEKGPAWLPELYENLVREMARYRRG